MVFPYTLVASPPPRPHPPVLLSGKARLKQTLRAVLKIKESQRAIVPCEVSSFNAGMIKEMYIGQLHVYVEKAMATHSSTHAWKIPWTEEPGGLQSMGSLRVDTTEQLHFHALEKEMATHSSVLAWRIPGTGEPGGLPSMGSHRVRHD